jgi:ribonuclease D
MSHFRKTITKDEIRDLPLRSFDEEIYMFEGDEDPREAIRYLNNQNILGFDTETKPSFRKGKRNTVALLQLSTADKAFLFRLNKIGFPNYLVEILSNEKIIKVGAAIRDDIKALQEIGRFEPKGFVDLQTFVKKFDIENFGLKNLAAIVLNIRISKSKQLSNWEADELGLPQQKYAATDAWVSYEIYKELVDKDF